MHALMILERAEKRCSVGEAMTMAEELNLPIQRVQRRILDDLANNGNHQWLVMCRSLSLLRCGRYLGHDALNRFKLSRKCRLSSRGAR